MLTIRHVAFEDLSAWGPVLEKRGWTNTYVDMGRDDLAAYDPLAPELLIILGGPLGVYDAPDYPFLQTEIAFIARRIEAGLPTVGICLGAQLLAAAAGARVYPSGGSEIGFAPIWLTEAARASCLSIFAEHPITLHWHGDTFDLPAGAELLASTVATAHQAFSIGPKILGVQFHPEWGATPFEPWLIAYKDELRVKGLDVAKLRAEAEGVREHLEAKAERVLEVYLAGAGLG